MTRWLQAARRVSEAGNLPKKPKQPPMQEVNSVNSVNSEGAKARATPALADGLVSDLYEERAAIREFEGGQDRVTADRVAWGEAYRTAEITALNDWRARADDTHDPDNWK